MYIDTRWIFPDLFRMIRLSQQLPVREQHMFSVWFSHQEPDPASIDPEGVMRAFMFSREGKFSDMFRFALCKAREELAITPGTHPCFDFTGYAYNLFEDNYLFIDGYVLKKHTYQ